MSEAANNVTLIPSPEDIDDIVSDPSQDGQATLVPTDNDKNHTNGHNDDKTEIKQEEEEDSDYDPPKFDAICEFLENEEGLDIYQLVAFRIKSGAGCLATRRKYELQFDGGDEDDNEEENKDDEEETSWFGYYMDIIKAIICFFTQFASIFVLYFYTSDMKEESGKTWCDQTSDLSSKIMAISYAFFLSLIFHLNFKNQKCGFYKNIDYHMYSHNFISSNWLKIGQLINGILALNVFYLSFLVIFFSTDPLDIILNCVALFFLLDIDNMVIDSTDYKKTLQWFKNTDNTDKYKKEKGNVYQVCIYFLFMAIYYLLIGLTYIGIVFVPFMVAVCY